MCGLPDRSHKAVFAVVLILIGSILLSCMCTGSAESRHEGTMTDRDEWLASYHRFVCDINSDACNDTYTLTIRFDNSSTVYFFYPGPDTYKDWIEDLPGKVVIGHEYLCEYRTWFIQIGEGTLVPFAQDDIMMKPALYYVIRTGSGEEVLEVMLYGIARVNGREERALWVNGRWVEPDDVFFRIVWPHLPYVIREMYQPTAQNGFLNKRRMY